MRTKLLRPTCAEIDLNAIDYNIKAIKRFIGLNCDIMAVVKANGYGHGMVEVSRVALKSGARMLGVAILPEGIELREADIEAPIVILGCSLPEEAEEIVKYGLTPVVTNEEIIDALAEAAERRKRKIKVHIKVDTGMGRVGALPFDVVRLAEKVRNAKNLELEGLCTHFAFADEPDLEFTKEQLAKFKRVLRELEHRGIRIPLQHAANSAAILRLPESHFNLVRPGLLMYGLSSFRGSEDFLEVHPALSLKTKIVQLKNLPAGSRVSYGLTHKLKRDSLVALIPIGYADGYSRRLSNKGKVIVQGKLAPIIGRVCMDQCIIDVTDCERIRLGDEVIVIGEQGNVRITANRVADWAGTIVNEVVSTISRRVPRIYFRSGEVLGGVQQ